MGITQPMSAKQGIKTIVEVVTNNYLYRRNLRRLAQHEMELQLLPIFCDREKPCLDIGANRGLYIHHLLPICNRVIAFEPLPPMQDLLRKVYGKKITLEPVALSDADGEIELRFPAGNYSWATIEGDNNLALADVPIQTEKVKTRRLDGYGFDRVGFIKIDVEGHEEAVLRGALGTLKRTSPVLLIEIENRHKAGAVARISNLLANEGYACHFVSQGKLHAINAFEPARDQAIENVGVAGRVGHYINNFIFIPLPKVEQVTAAIRAMLPRLAASH